MSPVAPFHTHIHIHLKTNRLHKTGIYVNINGVVQSKLKVLKFCLLQKCNGQCACACTLVFPCCFAVSMQVYKSFVTKWTQMSFPNKLLLCCSNTWFGDVVSDFMIIMEFSFLPLFWNLRNTGSADKK